MVVTSTRKGVTYGRFTSAEITYEEQARAISRAWESCAGDPEQAEHVREIAQVLFGTPGPSIPAHESHRARQRRNERRQ